jgi:hypothetical protein
MLPAPNARAGLAKQKRRTNPSRIGKGLKVVMARWLCLVYSSVVGFVMKLVQVVGIVGEGRKRSRWRGKDEKESWKIGGLGKVGFQFQEGMDLSPGPHTPNLSAGQP